MTKLPRTSVTEVPFDAQGNLMHYATPRRQENRRSYETAHEWRPNDPFQATIVIDNTRRGRSAAYFMCHNHHTKVTYPLFINQALTLIQNSIITNGMVTGWWRVAKGGQNYSLSFLGVRRPEGI